MQRSFLTRILSRKFILAFGQTLAGILLMIGYGENEVATISGAVVSVISTVVYIYTEGKIDAISVGQTAGQVQDAINEIKDGKNVE